MSDELDLGIAPAKPKPTRPEEPERPKAPNYSWAKYVAMNPRYCDICLTNIPIVAGVPSRTIHRAVTTEDGPEGRMWLCSRHKAERSVRLG